jgi:hypothetical protein
MPLRRPIGYLIRDGKLLEVRCENCGPERHLYFNPEVLRLPKRMPVVSGYSCRCRRCAVQR